MVDAVASSMDASAQVTCQELSTKRSFQPDPPGVPQRRLSGGTR
ncbi:hypothetical protein [Leptothoe sp. PORK10 BA2]|nr:hypothetical protein [Leptothoe sp. PORK10 BA2]MEA5464939.1 hypothetical protein [Leptothoe sp. PORK10 BA2]